MMPVIVIADPALTVGLPAHVTAATGMDALAHNLEAYLAPGYHPLAEGIGVEGVRLVKEWLPVAVKDGKNLVARSHMMAAAAMGATAFQKGLGAIHALSHPVGAVYDTHHGLTNAVVMPYVLLFNRQAIEPKLIRLAAWLGLPNPSFTSVPRLGARAAQGDRDSAYAERSRRRHRQARSALRDGGPVDPTAGGNPIPIGCPNSGRCSSPASKAGWRRNPFFYSAVCRV
jgi:alcohol dehydrogenase class IV